MISSAGHSKTDIVNQAVRMYGRQPDRARGGLRAEVRRAEDDGRELTRSRRLQKPVHVTKRVVVSQGEEPGVVISIRVYDRLIERLDACKPGGWADLWLAGAGAGMALAGAAIVGALTLPTTLTGTRDVLWTLAAAGAVVLILCLVGYFTQRRDHQRDIAELRKDLEIQK